MNPLVEHNSRKAARILDAARELVLDHGAGKVTVAEIAQAAGVGKGTVYLYWPGKEDLIRGLFARDLLTGMDELITRLTADAATVQPRHLAPLLLRAAGTRPLARLVHGNDPDLLRLLTPDPADHELFARTRPSALCEAVMPVLHRHRLIRHDRPLPDQTYTMHALLTGFLATTADPTTGVDDPGKVLADTIAVLFEPPAAPARPAVTAAADRTLAIFHETRKAVLDLIDRSQTP
ncbi:TetR/AcrR family transcriptional regulator [Actinomadura rugatobispora]|uniref:TetR/AcrR family transcriptional regulator n=1 Tax=Actinomadura rugatobispora TaxID=1994 RepID=A0ABW1A5L5_9ACTN|nr:TetR/AcrR family transcriptional regulator [Actinomadura rugatobispora]